MPGCRVCFKDLKTGTQILHDLDGQSWKSCPRCPVLAGIHVFLRFPKDFGLRPGRVQRIPQSRCYFHREMGPRAEECRLCRSTELTPFADIATAVNTTLGPPDAAARCSPDPAGR